MLYKADIVIVGAGVVGLAIAAEVASQSREVYVLEKNETFGLEVSGRHSGVIHSGIYYPENSFKAKMCLAGSRTLYELCERYSLGHKRVGKLIVATSDEEARQLPELLEQGRRNGVEGLSILSRQEVRRLEPNVEAAAAILSPSTGIIDSQALMRYYLAKASAGGAQIAYQARVVGIDRAAGGYRVTVDDGAFSFVARAVINCAGLYSDKIAEMAGIDIDRAGYRLHYCKGEYFSISKRALVSRLIYPVPPPSLTGVGIHVTFDLDGRMRLGPSAYYVDSIDYTVDDKHKQLFYDSVKRFLPAIKPGDLEPEMAGIRPKLQGPGDNIKDFLIRDEGDSGLPGFINLIGIESPGMTASPAIASYVGDLVEALLA